MALDGGTTPEKGNQIEKAAAGPEDEEPAKKDTRGRIHKLWSRTLGRDRGYSTAVEQTKMYVRERAKELEQNRANLGEAQEGLKQLEYEVKARAKPQEFKQKDERPIQQEDMKALKKILGKPKRYKDDGRITDPKSIEQTMEAVGQLDKMELSPEDLAVVVNLEHRLKVGIKKMYFDRAATAMLADKDTTYTPDQMRLFLNPPTGDTMDKTKAMEALTILENLGKRPGAAEDAARLAGTEKMIRQMSNLPKGNWHQRETVNRTAAEISPDNAYMAKVQDIFNKHRTANKRRYHRLPRIERFHDKNARRDMLAGIQELKRGKDLTGEERKQLVETEEELNYENKRALFKGVSELINKDASKKLSYGLEERQLFKNPPRGETMDEPTAKRALGVIDKLRLQSTIPIKDKDLLNETEDLIRVQANMPNRSAGKNSKKRR
jgi:hypothetical protein